mmetsp:Transcript_28673/g.48814  ORF Transcript_28673/g.48814 Transcript_28673/m.48814 type:complete len:86 (+) Transcript_28673:925-1182(+)
MCSGGIIAWYPIILFNLTFCTLPEITVHIYSKKPKSLQMELLFQPLRTKHPLMTTLLPKDLNVGTDLLDSNFLPEDLPTVFAYKG